MPKAPNRVCEIPQRGILIEFQENKKISRRSKFETHVRRKRKLKMELIGGYVHIVGVVDY